MIEIKSAKKLIQAAGIVALFQSLFVASDGEFGRAVFYRVRRDWDAKIGDYPRHVTSLLAEFCNNVKRSAIPEATLENMLEEVVKKTIYESSE
jgi:hypothetical protein